MQILRSNILKASHRHSLQQNVMIVQYIRAFKGITLSEPAIRFSRLDYPIAGRCLAQPVDLRTLIAQVTFMASKLDPERTMTVPPAQWAPPGALCSPGWVEGCWDCIYLRCNPRFFCLGRGQRYFPPGKGWQSSSRARRRRQVWCGPRKRRHSCL